MTQIFTIIFEDCDMYNVEIVKSFLTLEKAKDFLTKYCFDSDMETMMEDEQALFETMWAMKYGESNDEDEEDFPNGSLDY